MAKLTWDEHLKNIRCSDLNRNEVKYRKTGHAYLTGGGGGRTKPVYDNVKLIQEGLKFNDMEADYTPSDFFFTEFKVKPAKVPYSNAAHHLLSCDVFTDKPKERIFNDKELAILWAVDYDVNDGQNVIFLPGYNDGGEVQALIRRSGLTFKQWAKLPEADRRRRANAAKRRARARTHKYANLHRLPCHYDYHPQYIKKVKVDMKRLQPRLRRPKKPCKTWKPPASIFGFLVDRQHAYWRWIVGFGKRQALGKPKSINDITGAPPKKGLVK